MEVKGKKFVSLYLTDWQMRMVRDFLHIDCHQMTVPVDAPGGLRYFGPTVDKSLLDPTAKRMYLTDWQRREIRDVAGADCEFIELHHDVVVKYGGPPARQIEEMLKHAAK